MSTKTPPGPPPKADGRVSHADRAARRLAVARDLKSGLTLEACVAKYGLSGATVYSIARGAGIPTTARGGRTLAILATLLNTGKPLWEVGSEHKVSRARVTEVLIEAKKVGIKFPHRKD